MSPSGSLRRSPACSNVVLPAALLAIALTYGVADSRPGDIVALVSADHFRPVTTGPTAVSLGNRPGLLADAQLTRTLSSFGLDRITALGPPTRAGRAGMRLVLLSPSAGPLDEATAGSAARALVRGGQAIAATVDRNLKLSATLPNDPDLPAQWYVDGPADIHLPEAWDLELGSTSVVIGILDTGVDTGHPDLASQIWTNPGEIPANGIDDDLNGYVDDVHGWDFGDGDADANPTPMFDTSGIDVGFHGTAVAGVASAATNNSEGIAGAGWNSKILPLKISNSAGGTPVSAAGEAILYAAAMGIDVLNMSVGASNPDSATTAFFQAALDQALAADVVCVAAAGNDGASAPVVPASCNGVLAVGATGDTDQRASFSNYGPWVDVAAPGETIWAPICRNYPIDDTSVFIYEFFFGYDGVRPYMYADGTSFSCPLVSGVCALVRAHFPGARAVGVMDHVKNTGDAIAYDQPIGKKVNAYAALATTLGVGLTGGPTATLTLAHARPTPFTSSTTLAYTLGLSSRVRLSIVDAAGRNVRTLVSADQPAGPHAATWDGRDNAGRAAPAGLYFGVLEGAGTRATVRLVRID